MEFTKQHLPYPEQLRLLASRDMDVGDHNAAVGALKRIGYYRLSAYTYPMRAWLPEPTLSGRPQRADRFVEGSRLADAVALHDFDHRLRKALLPAIQTLEVSLRSKIAYHLSKHGPMAHLDRTGLDSSRCDEIGSGSNSRGTKYESWRREYDSLQYKARSEEYVKHFRKKYDGQMPIWAACEFMTMGCLIALYRLMQPSDAKRIAAEFQVKNQNVLFGWLKALNVERNHCAHNARIWNRSTTYPPSKINAKMVGPELHHLIGADQNKVYFLAAVLTYLLRQVDVDSRFASEFRTVMKKFPNVLGMTPENTMGFVPGWKDQDLWRV